MEKSKGNKVRVKTRFGPDDVVYFINKHTIQCGSVVMLTYKQTVDKALTTYLVTDVSEGKDSDGSYKLIELQEAHTFGTRQALIDKLAKEQKENEYGTW